MNWKKPFPLIILPKYQVFIFCLKLKSYFVLDLGKLVADNKAMRNQLKNEKEKQTKVPIVSLKCKFVLNFNPRFFNVNKSNLFVLNHFRG